MTIEDLLNRARDTFTARLVYAEPHERDGVTVIPAARVYGGGGGGTGSDHTGRRGEGGGLGLVARPVGAFVIRGEEVHWVPAVDVNRLILTAAATALGAVFLHRRQPR